VEEGDEDESTVASALSQKLDLITLLRNNPEFDESSIPFEGNDVAQNEWMVAKLKKDQDDYWQDLKNLHRISIPEGAPTISQSILMRPKPDFTTWIM
jgi:hypothetical protein